MKKYGYLLIAIVFSVQPVVGLATDIINDKHQEIGSSSDYSDEIRQQAVRPTNNEDGTVEFVGKSWDVIQDYGDGIKMIAMENKIGDSIYSLDYFFNKNEDDNDGYQESVVKATVDEWYKNTIAGSPAEEFVQPVTSHNITLGEVKKKYYWKDNTNGSIGYSQWADTIVSPQSYPTTFGAGKKEAFILSGSDVTKEKAALSDNGVSHLNKLKKNGIDSSWLTSQGGHENMGTILLSDREEVSFSVVTESHAVVPALVVQTFDKVEEASPVTVKYQDEDGNELAESVVLNGEVGSAYQSTPASIDGWTLKETPANANGTFTEEAQEVIYVYERTEAKPVTVKYQDEDGNELALSTTLNGKVGLPYQTSPASIDGWVLKGTPVNATGTFTEKAQEVVYVYERTEAKPVTVKYQDEEGNELAPSTTLNGKVGLPYQTNPTSIDGWVLKDTPVNANGTFTEKAQEVVYVYERTEAKPVTVKYQDEEGNELAPSTTLNGKVGLPYQTTPASIDGWVVKDIPVNATGTFTEKAQEVVYVYERTEAKPVTVKYQDEEGNKLSGDVVLNGKLGLSYQTTPANIDGWMLKATPTNATGTFTEKAQEVIYVYERTAAKPVTVKYQDEKGNELAPSATLNGKVGLPYQTTPASIDGWALTDTPVNATGTFTEKAQEVVYVYEQEDGEVIINHVDEDGNPVAPQEVIKGPIDSDFNSDGIKALPQTGENTSILIATVGTLLIALFGLLFLKRRNKDA
ncbi:LPXTG cell wall anchor domain-containing protein [Vagococcus coleopterorum]|uniref:LPXTG cell wall anchor domain-containing protein n=1 Tax=Vagococcus coleopterorum TaxID=2714946 RepID=A0A6G8AMR2_9ENTE|nr:MucBP domain-containing protein [Vagococcus coleopterorum]QIL46213.1 LPXTG cell wall anchor domain-containing protein [Vagococcus coleopterorum]